MAIKSNDIKQVYYSQRSLTCDQNGAHCQAPIIIEAKIKVASESGVSRFPAEWEGFMEEPEEPEEPEDEPEEAPEEPEEPLVGLHLLLVSTFSRVQVQR